MALYLIDTNVMVAASASHDEHSGVINRAMPREVELREQVHAWLHAFEQSDDALLMDEAMLIMDEYERNLPFSPGLRHQEYGLQVLQQKHDRGLIEYVPIEVQEANGEKVAVLSDDLARIVTDREDRKWVAAAQAAREYLGLTVPIVYAAESDWVHIEQALRPYGIEFSRLLPDDWYKTG